MDRFALIGGLGVMFAPSAHHLRDHQQMRIVRVLDRGHAGAWREQARSGWRAYGADLVSDYPALLAQDCDGVIICAGKNGGDLEIIQHVIQHWQAIGQKHGVIVHCSTVSSAFVLACSAACTVLGYDYVNYPLTGGALGAKEGRLCIFASGSAAVFARQRTWLACLGTPHYYGVGVNLAAQVKLMNQVMVFSGLQGMSTAVMLRRRCQGLAQDREHELAFFDALSQGAGGTRQWALVLRHALERDDWAHGFRLSHAYADLLYVVQWMLTVSDIKALYLPYLFLALVLIYCHKHLPGGPLATQALVLLNQEQHGRDLDQWLDTLLALPTPAEQLRYCESLLSQQDQREVGLFIDQVVCA
jgi:3-hydroxyisobutyrate dehydrogenase-like beta-hydroxyacid dehydrogenase